MFVGDYMTRHPILVEPNASILEVQGIMSETNIRHVPVVETGKRLVGLVTRRPALHYWSRALGRTGLVFWISYLPISMWAMQTNWNGLFLAEPRWRVGLIFAIGGLVLQVGVSLLEDPVWASVSNILFAGVLFMALQTTEQVMHPTSPIFGSDAVRIQVFFVTLLALTLLAAWQVARLWHGWDMGEARVKNR